MEEENELFILEEIDKILYGDQPKINNNKEDDLGISIGL